MDTVVRGFICFIIALVGGVPFSTASAGIQAMEKKLTASDGALSDFFGSSVAISGNYAVVGAPEDDDVAHGAGAAYVFKRENGIWTQQQKLTAPDGGVWSLFGCAAAVSGDTIIVGACQDPDQWSIQPGAAYIFKNKNGTWAQTAKLKKWNFSSDAMFGYSVAVSNDYAVIGSPEYKSGFVYIFKREGQTWSRQQKLYSYDGSVSDRFGWSVALSGNHLVVGVKADKGADGLPMGTGSAYVYRYDGSAWLPDAKLVPKDRDESDRFGAAVAVSGNHIIVGAAWDDAFGPYSGAAYLFKLENGTWTEQARLTASDGGGGDHFGAAVAIDGNIVAVGATREADAADTPGAVYIFRLENGTWTEQAKLTASDGAGGDHFGAAVAVSAPHVLAGARLDNDNGYESGAAYVYGLSSGSGSQCTVTLPTDLSFEFANALYPSLTGDRYLSLSFKYFGENSGKLLWELQHAGVPDLLSCPMPIAPDLSFTINDAAYHSPDFGIQEVWAGFKFFGLQNDKLLWELVGAGGK